MAPIRQPTDTIFVTVSELRYPVNESVLRDVFQSISPVTRVQLIPQTNPNTVSGLVTFSDARAAAAAIQQRNGRHIYSDCNRMSIEFAASSQEQQQQQPVAPIFSTPPHMMAAAAQSLLPVPGQQQTAQGMQQQQQMNPAAAAALLAQQQQQQQQQQQLLAGMMASNNPLLMQQQSQQQQFLQQQQLLAAMAAAAQQMGSGINIGGRGGGMGGGVMLPGMFGGANFGGQMMSPYGAGSVGVGRGGMMVGGRGGANAMMMMQAGAGGGAAVGIQPYVSINEVSTEAPLNDLFNLLETFGAVASIRRTSKQGIVHIKMYSAEDAENVARNVHKVPFWGAEISARTMPTFIERTEAPIGDPTDPTCNAHDFRGARHRPRGVRCRHQPSNVLRLHIRKEPRTPDEIRDFFANLGINIVSVEKDTATNRTDDVLVVFNDTADAVRALIASVNRVCNVEGGAATFASLPRQPGAAAGSAAAAGATSEETPVAA